MQIMTTGVKALRMTVDTKANEYVATLSQGLPHYTHLLGLHSTRQAIDTGDKRVQLKHIDAGIKKSIEGAQQTLQRAYHKATISRAATASTLRCYSLAPWRRRINWDISQPRMCVIPWPKS